MRALDQLRALRDLIAPSNVWLPGRSDGAADATGHSCPPRSPGAARFGLLGGLIRLRGDVDERLRAVALLCRAVGAKHLYAWEQEPGRTEAEVREAVERAIALEEEEDRAWA